LLRETHGTFVLTDHPQSRDDVLIVTVPSPPPSENEDGAFAIWI
jgi:hypothetical protein